MIHSRLRPRAQGFRRLIWSNGSTRTTLAQALERNCIKDELVKVDCTNSRTIYRRVDNFRQNWSFDWYLWATIHAAGVIRHSDFSCYLRCKMVIVFLSLQETDNSQNRINYAQHTTITTTPRLIRSFSPDYFSPNSWSSRPPINQFLC